MRLSISIIFLLMLFACNPDKDRLVDRNEPIFKTNDATRLFFKNVRLLYYDLEEQNEGKIQILKLGDRIDDSSEAIINVYIINNWHQDRAYPMISPSAYFDGLEVIDIEMIKADGSSEIITFDTQSNMDEHFYVATSIYEGLLKKYKFKLSEKGKELFTDSDQREAFRVTMVDFYRLVGIY